MAEAAEVNDNGTHQGIAARVIQITDPFTGMAEYKRYGYHATVATGLCPQ